MAKKTLNCFPTSYEEINSLNVQINVKRPKFGWEKPFPTIRGFPVVPQWKYSSWKKMEAFRALSFIFLLKLCLSQPQSIYYLEINDRYARVYLFTCNRESKRHCHWNSGAKNPRNDFPRPGSFISFKLPLTSQNGQTRINSTFKLKSSHSYRVWHRLHTQ